MNYRGVFASVPSSILKYSVDNMRVCGHGWRSARGQIGAIIATSTATIESIWLTLADWLTIGLLPLNNAIKAHVFADAAFLSQR